ncbi:type II toxin-antitoxin system HicA family toxin [Paenibacillus taichungensis]|uniref:type II toxin-antitoxin system HicA family toxin n=1 Tax=Paenibacillus taichungensis TaxID=484184 RepID=UPI0038D0C8F0
MDLQLFSKNKFPVGQTSGKDIVKFLKKDGFDVISQNGSHLKLKGPNGKTVIFPVHGNKVF